MKHHQAESCREILQRLNAYIDDELDADLCATLEAHLETCSDCQIIVNTLNQTIVLCQKDGEQTTLPIDAKQRLYASLGLEDDDPQVT
jgi:anti-sigma factor RsiW